MPCIEAGAVGQRRIATRVANHATPAPRAAVRGRPDGRAPLRPPAVRDILCPWQAGNIPAIERLGTSPMSRMGSRLDVSQSPCVGWWITRNLNWSEYGHQHAAHHHRPGAASRRRRPLLPGTPLVSAPCDIAVVLWVGRRRCGGWAHPQGTCDSRQHSDPDTLREALRLLKDRDPAANSFVPMSGLRRSFSCIDLPSDPDYCSAARNRPWLRKVDR
jgi:hypothetical protein